MKTGIYKITNLINNKVYVGCSIELEKRKMQHFADLRHNHHFNEYLQRSYNKYSEENFVFEILEECLVTELFKKENFWCQELNSHNILYGYNIEPTSEEGNPSLSEETKEKIRIKATNRIVLQETKDKISKNNFGRKQKSPNKISETKKLFYNKIKKAKKTPTYKRHGMLGKHHTNESKLILRLQRLGVSKTSNYRKVLQFNRDGSFIKEWNSIKEAQDTLNISNISAACSSSKRTAGGYSWEYKSATRQSQ